MRPPRLPGTRPRLRPRRRRRRPGRGVSAWLAAPLPRPVRPGRRRLAVIEIRQGDSGEALADLALDAGQRQLFRRRDEHEGVALRLRPGRAADAMNIVVRDAWYIETHDVGDVVHVQS